MPDRATIASPQPPLDEGTAAALTLYNTYLVADREQQARERAVRKAEKAKDEAAAALRKLNERKAPAEETAAADAAYREAVEALKRARNGEAPPTKNRHSGDEAAGDQVSGEGEVASDEDS